MGLQTPFLYVQSKISKPNYVSTSSMLLFQKMEQFNVGSKVGCLCSIHYKCSKGCNLIKFYSSFLNWEYLLFKTWLKINRLSTFVSKKLISFNFWAGFVIGIYVFHENMVLFRLIQVPKCY
jgi:hypothetical protein